MSDARELLTQALEALDSAMPAYGTGTKLREVSDAIRAHLARAQQSEPVDDAWANVSREVAPAPDAWMGWRQHPWGASFGRVRTLSFVQGEGEDETPLYAATPSPDKQAEPHDVDKLAVVEQLLDRLIEQDPERAERFIESQLARLAVRKRLATKQTAATRRAIVCAAAEIGRAMP